MRVRRVQTVREARALLEELGLLTAAPVSSIASLARAVGGPSTTANWWAHPEGQKIFTIATQLGDDQDVLVCKLVRGKLTFVHRRLWPALHALVVKVTSRAMLSPDARRLLREIEERESARTTELRAAIGLDGVADRGRFSRAKDQLESRLLAVASAEDREGESHSHVATLRPWRRCVPADVARAGARLRAALAVQQIVDAALSGSEAGDETSIRALLPLTESG